MRAHEFLIEYSREITAANFGEKIFAAFSKEKAYNAPDGLYNALYVVDRALNQNRYDQNINSSVDIFGKRYVVNKNSVVDVVNEIKPTVINTILAYVEERDPTRNKQYTQWLARMYANGGVKLEDLNRGNLVGIYDIGKKRRMIKPEHSDINRFKTYRDFETAIVDNYDIEQLSNNVTSSAEKGKYKIFYEDSNVTGVIPLDLTASRHFGKNARWCTLSSDQFSSHISKGNLYILLPKHPKYDGEKYQLHFQTEQFMDENDDPVDIYELLTSRFPTVLGYFKANESEINNLIPFMSDEVLQPVIERMGEIIDEYVWGQIGEWEMNDDYFRSWQEEQARERGYVIKPDGYDEMSDEEREEADDERDEWEVDWDLVHEDDELNSYTDYSSEADQYSRTANSIVTMTPNALREYWSELEEPRAKNIADLYVLIVRNEFPAYRYEYEDGGLSDYIDRHVRTLFNNDGTIKVEVFR